MISGPRSSTAGALLALFVFAAEATAHGGQYRGPVPPALPGLPGGPPTGVPIPGAPGPVGPNTGGRPGSSDDTSWQVWWEFNKEQFQRAPAVELPLAITGSDEFWLGSRRNMPSRPARRPDDRDRKERIAPALVAVLRRERNRDLVTASLVGLAKLGVDAPGVDLDREFSAQLARDDQEVRETAALSFGIAGRTTSLAVLADLLGDAPAGRKLLGRSSVDDRTRAFAAHSLGQLAMRSPDVAVKQRVHDRLAPLLVGKENNREVLIGVVSALGVTVTDLGPPRCKLLAWQTVDELWAFYHRDLGKADQMVQAHVPTAVGRLLGRGTSTAHQKAKRILAAELTARSPRLQAIRQSAALALGQLCVPAETATEDQEFHAVLLRTYGEATDQQTRFFALLALGRIGGAANRKALLELYPKANAATERPWVALALGLIAFQSRLLGTVDQGVAGVLGADLTATANTEARAAIAVALGLTGHRPAAAIVLQLLADVERQQVLAGYLCTSLGLLGDPIAVAPLTELMLRSVRQPFLMQQAAIALGQLGDDRAVPLLVELLAQHDSTAALAAIAGALTQIRDRRSIDALLVLLDSPQPTKLARAFAAAALGGVGDKDEVAWNVPLSRDVNYRAAVDTLTNGRSGVLDIL